ncbi:hypothetical protein ATO67_19810 [Agrobacterium bohemicum]|uniref:Uncharacterized protein n=1 Tax=Agrobacterium bohemicum TaxID=2052828 RepID=A0A135P764_9HYPH|nr:hypothetical protein ATO67_19810 [Agrobacterium bohemicum]
MMGRKQLINSGRSSQPYHSELERHQSTLNITDWIIFFSETILDAQRVTLERIDFFIQKAKFYDRFDAS